MKKTGVALFVYKRPNLTLETINHLKNGLKNSNIKKLYIFQDGLKKDEDKDQWIEVNKLIKNIDFIDKELIISDTNKGLANSIIYGINYVLKENDRVITIEDDCVIAQDYFNFMEKCFDKYENDNKVMCVSGYGWPINVKNEYKWSVYFSFRMSSIGWGTWKDRWNKYSRNFNLLNDILNDKKKKAIYDIIGDDFNDIVNGQLRGKCDSWTVFWQLMQTNEFGVCVQPIKSVAKDIGRDGSGTNSVSFTSKYEVDLYEGKTENFLLPDKIIHDNDINKEITKFFKIVPMETRLNQYYELLNLWIKNYNTGLSLEKYLKNNKKNIYIYGCGKLAERIYEEIIKYSNVDGFIVKGKVKNNFCNCEVIDINQHEKYKDSLIIVSPIYDYDNIQNELKKIENNLSIISLEKLIQEEMK